MTTPVSTSLEDAYRSLDPQEALAPGSSAYAERPIAPLATLATQLRLGGGRGGIHLVSGHIGSGKTTELRRLASLFESNSTRTLFLPLDSNSGDGQLDAADVAVALAVALSPKSSPKSKILQALEAFAGVTVLVSPAPVEVSQETGRSRLANQAVDILRESLKDYPQPTIVLLDGLDKLSLNEIERTLVQLLAWDLPLTLVTTAPLSYLFTPAFSRREGSFAGVHVVPALPVVGRDFDANPAALAWFEQVLVSRGVRDLFDTDAVDLIALQTAGILRDFIRSCREAVLTALVQRRERVDAELARIALDEFALRMSRPVSGDDLRVLNVVAETGRVVGHSTFLALIDGGQIVEYRNGSNWYAVHPLLRDIVARFAKEIAT